MVMPRQSFMQHLGTGHLPGPSVTGRGLLSGTQHLDLITKRRGKIQTGQTEVDLEGGLMLAMPSLLTTSHVA